jgi:PHD/YefM family antitoxin component YafN of YafNO toxin-antitoxin module
MISTTNPEQELPPLQYVADSDGKPISVFFPIDLWEQIQQEIRSERETSYLLSSETMRACLREGKSRTEGIPMEEARARLGI